MPKQEKEWWEVAVEKIQAREADQAKREREDQEKARRCMELVRAVTEYMERGTFESMENMNRVYKRLKKDGVI